MHVSIIEKATTVSVTGRAVIGFEIPMCGNRLLIKHPLNITKVILRPIEYRRVLTRDKLWTFRILRMRIPGMKVRKRNPTTCLRTGMPNPKVSEMTVSSITNWTIAMTLINFPVDHLFMHLIS